MLLLKPKNIFKLLCHALLVLSIVFILLLNSFPWFLNINYLQNRLFQIVTNQTQLTIQTNDIDFDLFPEPAVRLKGLTIKSIGDTEYSCQTILLYPNLNKLIKGIPVLNKILILNSNLFFIPTKKSSSKNFNIPDLFQTTKIEKYIDKEKGLLISVKNFKHDFAEKLDIQIEILGNQKIFGSISITNFALNKEFLKKYHFNNDVFNLHSNNSKELIFIKSLKANFNVTDQKAQIILSPILFDYPSMILDIKFFYNNKTEKAFIEFSGKNVNIEQAKTAYFDLFNKEEVSENLFDIVRAGNASKISVLFKEKKLKNLFSPNNMILKGELEDGDIKIPNTKLIPAKVYGTALIKNGILSIKAEKARLHNFTKIHHGTLEINLLNHQNYPFHGTFGIHTPLAELKDILIELFEEDLLGQELKLVNDVTGYVNGELRLELKNGENLDVLVTTEDIDGSGEYLRAPGRIKINRGKFRYQNEIVTLTDFAGKIGKSYYYDFSALYRLDNSNLIDIESGKALIDSNEVLNWILDFEPVSEAFPNFRFQQGYVRVDSTDIKGDIFNLDELEFNIQGSLKDNRLKQESSIDSNLVSSCDFIISNQEISFNKVFAEVADIDLVSNFTLNKEIKDIATPFIVKNASYKLTQESDSFNSKLEFPNGLKVELYCSNNNKEEFYLKTLEIEDNQNNNIKFLTDTEGNIDFYKFIGQINTKTLEKIFKKDSTFYNQLIAYTDKKDVIIKSKDGKLITILADTLDLEQVIDQIFIKNNDLLFTNKHPLDNFPEKHLKVKASFLTYQESFFNNFNVDLLIKKNGNKFHGKLDLDAEQGKIHSLTLISRILSAINISNYFKGGGPDFQQMGFKYKSLKAKSHIVNNIIILDEAVIDAQDMTLVFKGTIDLNKNELDLTCLVAPFKTIDLLVENIPVVNTMLNNTLISIPVKVSGRIGDPTVVPLHPASVGKGIVNLFANIIKGPFKLLNKVPGNGTSAQAIEEKIDSENNAP
jgi:hypothetical protein